MSLFNNLLDEQIDILKEKGYNEKSINSPDKEGTLFTQLRRNFSGALRESWLEGEPVTFQVPAIGFFNDDADIVLFKLGYEFDLEKNMLAMKTYELISDRLHRKIDILSPKDIPHSAQALSILQDQHLIKRKRANRESTIQRNNKKESLDGYKPRL